MFVDCSEISINVIAKHVQYVGIIWACSLPGINLLWSFSVLGGTEKIAGWIGGLAGLLGGGSIPRLTLCQMWPFN